MLADLQLKPQEQRKEARLIMLYKVIINKIALESRQLPTHPSQLHIY